jgi:hypothetical protein
VLLQKPLDAGHRAELELIYGGTRLCGKKPSSNLLWNLKKSQFPKEPHLPTPFLGSKSNIFGLKNLSIWRIS